MNATDIVQARRSGNRIGGRKRDEIAAAIKPFLIEVFTLKDVAYDLSKDINAPADQLAAHLSVEYPWFTIEEVRLAMRLGVTGELGNDTRLCGATYFAWLRNFNKSADRKGILEEAEIATKKLDTRLRGMIAPEELERRNGDFLAYGPGRAFKTFKELGRQGFKFNAYLSAVFDALCRQGRIGGLSEAMKERCDRAARKYVWSVRNGDGDPHVREVEIAETDQTVYENAYKAEAALLYFEYAASQGIEIPYQEITIY